MRYLTDYKRASGRGAARTGTQHHWAMQVSSVILLLLVPAFIYIFGAALGGTRAEVLAVFARPVPAILTALALIVGLVHFRKGAQTMIEDYAQGITRKALILVVVIVSYGAMATGLYALMRLAFLSVAA